MPVFVLSAAAFAAAEPFHAEWNWEDQKLHGRVKSVTTEAKPGKQYEEYDKDGKKIRTLLHDEFGKVTHEIKLKYNKDGDLNKVTVIQKGLDKPLLVEKADYKSKGVIRTVTRTAGEKVMKSEPFVYGKDGRLKEISIKTGPMLTTWAYTFDKEGNLTGFELRRDGKVTLSAVYEKHEKGNARIMKSFRNGKPASDADVSYKYDKHGNWTERTAKPILYDPKGKRTERPPHVTKRKIEYHK
jgi:hypothetical protein